MNRFERLFGLKGEARVTYQAGEFRIDVPGDFVVCAVTGKPIALADLRYWSVELQEPYISAEASLERQLELRSRDRQDTSSRSVRTPRE
ncbi:MAG: DUF2093 domain-containing protein [Hyphomicrobiaceae bacterium]|nr:DUF2093 domain-containing protein [Hyphomicrobiaceae bacterium]